LNQQNLAGFIWSVADLLRGDFKRSEFGRVILPFTLLRRLECVLEPKREAVLKRYAKLKDSSIELDTVLPKVSGHRYYNTSRYQLANLGETETRANLEDYLSRFSENTRQIFDYFNFAVWLDRLIDANLLYLVVQKFAGIDLHPQAISNHEMGLVFEELIRRFAESANDTAGEYFTPRDVVRLATTLIFAPDQEVLTGEGVVRTIYDPCCGTGGFLASGIEQVHEWTDKARTVPFGQELNPESYAIAMADMMVKGYDPKNIHFGNTLSDDKLPFERFNYCLANPPFGVDWKKAQKAVTDENRYKGHDGRFGPGLPRVSDGSLLFLMHLLSKRSDNGGGTRIGIVLNGSPPLHRRGRLRRVGDPPLDSGERLAGGDRRPAHRSLLQHRYRHLHLGAQQPQGEAPQRQGAAHRRHQPVGLHAQEPRQQAPLHYRQTNRRYRTPARCLQKNRDLKDLLHHRLRL